MMSEPKLKEIHMRVINRIGQVYDKLTVISRAENTSLGHSRWNCICECGNKVVLQGSDISKAAKPGAKKSCIDCAIAAKKTHGMSKSRVYILWTRLVQRATNPNCEDYKKFGYGAKGMDTRWKKFENFYADMGDPPSNKHSIDRIDNSKGYSKENCRWATLKEQARNKTNNKLVTYRGETKSLAEWCESLKLDYHNTWYKLYTRKDTVEVVFSKAIT